MAAAKKNVKKTTKPNTSKKKNSPPPKQGHGGELFGLLVMGVAIVSFVVLLTTGSDNIVCRLLTGVSGAFRHLTCAVLLWIGLLITFAGRKALDAGRVSMIAAGLMLLYALVHIFSARVIADSLTLGGGWLNFIRQSYITGWGAGAIGAILSYPAYALCGQWGGFAVLLVLLLIDVVMFARIPLRSLGEQAQTHIQQSYDDFRQRQSVRDQIRREERDERRRQRDSFNWDEPSVTDETPRKTVAQPPKPGTGHSASDEASPFEMPDALRAAAGRRRPVFSEKAEPTHDEPAYSEEAPVYEANPETDYGSAPDDDSAPSESVPAYDQTAVDDAPVYDAPAGESSEDEDDEPPFDIPGYETEAQPEQEPVDISDYREIPADQFSEDETNAAPAYDSDDDLFDNFDEDEDVAAVAPVSPVTGRDRRRPVLGETAALREPQQPKPSFTDAPNSGLNLERSTRAAMTQSAPAHENAALPVTGDEYNYPPLDLLAVPKPSVVGHNSARDQEKAQKLEETLHEFNINATLTDIAHGPTVTRFELAPAPGVKVSRITALSDDIALRLAAMSVRIEAPIPGKAAVGVEIPNDEIETVPLREVLESPEARKAPSRLAAAIGKDNAGRYVIGDIAKMPHVLIAGATGSGKSVCINCIICSILYRATPDEVRLIMIDPKVVELSIYNGIPHLLVPVVTDPKKASGALQWAVAEMTDRYKKFAAKEVRDIKGYNKKCALTGEKMMPQIVIIIDELADLMMVCPGEVEDSICRLAQLARAAGIHLVIATQRPSVNVITGVIKANIPARIAFTVSSFVDSRTILDVGGAEKLLGRGDMLFAPAGSNKMQRVQGAWVSDDEIHSIVEYIKNRHQAEYSADLNDFMESREVDTTEEPDEDPAEKESDKLLPQALEIAFNAGQVSISMLQRKLAIGYARAGRLVDELANRGVVSQAEGAKPRTVIMTRDAYNALYGKDGE